MATSGTINGTLTFRSCLGIAMQLLGQIGAGDTPSEDDALIAIPLANGMIKTWQADGCNLWRQVEDSAVFGAGVKTVALDPRVMDVMEARVVLAADNQRTLGRWEWGDYVSMPNKIATGSPTCFVLDKQRSAITMTVWPVPSASTVILYTAARVIEDITDLDDEIDIPQEWLECFYFSLAERLIAVFNADALSPAAAARVTTRAGELYRKMMDFDRPASVFMRPWNAPYSR